MGEDDKAVVIGMVERGGDVMTCVISDRKWWSVRQQIFENVKPFSTIYTDEAKVFKQVGLDDYAHDSVNHSKKEWARGDTNNIEAYWSNVKRSLRGTYVWVSKKHLQTYLCEFEYRYNLRKRPDLMMDVLLKAFSKA